MREISIRINCFLYLISAVVLMVVIDKIVEETKSKEGSAKKWTVVVGIIVGVLIGCVVFLGLFYVTEPLVDNMLSSEEIMLLFDFYDKMAESNETTVYFIGNSIVGTAVYAPLIDEKLLNQGYNISSYNLLSDGETPLLRALQIEKIAESHPALVIYGMSYAYVNQGNWIEERTVLAQGRYNLTPELASLYSEDELADLTRNLFFYKKGLLLRSTILPSSARTTENYVKEPYGIELRMDFDQAKSIDKIQDTVNSSVPVVTENMTRYKQALIYNIQTLQKAGIPVIIINMPIHPLLSEKITDETRQNYFDLLNLTGATWIDMETLYDDEHFRDTQHTTWNGSQDFSLNMVDLIIKQVENNVIHYS